MIAVSAVLVLSCGQTHTQAHTHTHTHTHTQADADERFTTATLIGASNYKSQRIESRPLLLNQHVKILATSRINIGLHSVGYRYS